MIGASGRSGASLVRALLARGVAVQPVARDTVRWRAAGIPAHPLLRKLVVADLHDHAALKAALAGAVRVVSTAHARTTHLLLAAAPAGARLVLLGSTRRYTRWIDAHGAGVLKGERELLESGRPGVMLHPSMIYGAHGENNVRRLAALLRRLPLVPLPGGGRALVQPIHQDDVTACIAAALEVPWTGPHTLTIAGGTALPYAGFVREVAAAAGLRQPRILSVPASVLMALAPFAGLLPRMPKISRDEIRRLTEDKAFDIGPMTAILGVRPIPLTEGLARTFKP